MMQVLNDIITMTTVLMHSSTKSMERNQKENYGISLGGRNDVLLVRRNDLCSVKLGNHLARPCDKADKKVRKKLKDI